MSKEFQYSLVDCSLDGMLRAIDAERESAGRLKCVLSSAENTEAISYLTLQARSSDLIELQDGWQIQGLDEYGLAAWDAEIIDIDRQPPFSIAVASDRPIKAYSGQKCKMFAPDFLWEVRSWINNKKRVDPRLPKLYMDLLAGQQLTPCKNVQDDLSRELIDRLALRPAQRQAVQMANRSFGIVWGPPGTGKTYTLGALAAVLLEGQRKVMVLAPTNVAADNAVLAIDEARNRLGNPLKPGELIRPGTPVLPELEEKEHLMAWNEVLTQIRQNLRILIKERQGLEKIRRRQNGALRKRTHRSIALSRLLEKRLKADRNLQLWSLAQNARIIVTTLHSAVNHDEIITSGQDEDISLIIDEAGMVPRFFLTRVLDINPEQVFLFGDFKQLGPVRQSPGRANKNSIHWVGESALRAVGLRNIEDAHRMEETGSLVMLTQQSRMQDSLCKSVSTHFYNGRLTALSTYGQPVRLPHQPTDGIVIANPDLWSEHFTKMSDSQSGDLLVLKNHCRNSVLSSVVIAQMLLEDNSECSALLLSPFRNQAAELHKFASDTLIDDGRWKAGTIHISQGQETDFVILSPVRPDHAWLTGKFGIDELERVICVAFSRAKTQVIVLVRPNELSYSPLLAKLCLNVPIWNPPGVC